MIYIRTTSLAILLFFACLFSSVGGAYAQEVRVSGEGLATRVAPGEFLPFSVKLLNFGLSRRVDVVLTYKILDSEGNEVFTQNETVAVETTASFVKQIQLPLDLKPGPHTAVSSIRYEFQEVPATSQFEFTVEPKIFGIFRSDFILYSFITLLIAVFGIVGNHLLFKNNKHMRSVSHDYSDKPISERIFFEIISDLIAQMRMHTGDDALEIAKGIPDLKIDEHTGKVLAIQNDPAKIIAHLVLRYETLLGRQIKIEPRGNSSMVDAKLEPVKKSVDVVRKYFEKQL